MRSHQSCLRIRHYCSQPDVNDLGDAPLLLDEAFEDPTGIEAAGDAELISTSPMDS